MKKYVLVTGANGKIGINLVKYFLTKKYNVIATYHNNKSNLKKINLKENSTLKIIKYQQHLEKSNIKLINYLKKNKIYLSGCINSSVIRPMKRGLNDKLKSWENSIRVNSNAIFLFNKFFCEYFKKNGGGKIVNIGSIYGCVGPDFNIYKNESFELEPDYVFIKFGMVGITKFFASKYGKFNVLVNTISPGGFQDKQSKRFIKKYSKKTLLNRMANYEEVLGLANFLISSEASYITGQNYIVDGGFTAN